MIINTLTALYFFEALSLMAIGLLAVMRIQSKPHIAFFVFAFLTGLWQMLQAFSIAFSDTTEAAGWLFVGSISATALMTTALYIFARVYVGKNIYVPLLPLAAAVAMLPVFSEGLHEVVITASGIGVPKLDLFYGLTLLYDVLMLVLSVATLVRYRSKASKKERARTTLLLTVAGVAGVIIILSSFYTSDFSETLVAKLLVPFTNMMALLGFLYAIVYRDLFDIHLFVLRAAAYISSYFMLAVLLVTPVIIVVSEVFDLKISAVNIALMSMTVVVLLYLSQMIKNKLDQITARYFFRRLYDPQALIDEHNSMLVAQSDSEKLLAASASIIDKHIQPERTVYWLKKRMNTSSHFHTQGKAFDFEEKKIKSLLKPELFERSQMCIVDNLPAEFDAAKEYFLSQGIAVIVHLVAPKDSHIGELGYLMLGFKKSGDSYGSRDEQTLQVLVNELVIAIQSAYRFEEIRNFNITLQEKVDKATAQLRQNNKKLHELDNSKDEFISMASHQLRTPLTAVKGYISMTLDGDLGPITKQQHQVLSQAFESSQRMAYLIGDFLNVSRLQTGKFELELSKIDITAMAREEVDQLEDTAKSRQISLVYDAPSQSYEIEGDNNKLRQVMMNFMDNAIYYSPAGGKVTVRVTKEPNGIVFKVIDTGIGVPAAERPKLFTKFFRATNARQQRPDGTGIGLYMAKKVVLAHGGVIIFETADGKGSTFGFRLPLKDKLK